MQTTTEKKAPTKMKMATDVKMIDPAKLKPYGKNPKIHSDEQIDRIANIIKHFGWDQPIVVDKKNVIIKGHGRWLAAQKLGLKSVPVILNALGENDARASRIADNRVAEAPWNEEYLQEDLKVLETAEYDLDLTGYDDTEIETYLRNAEDQGDIGNYAAPEASGDGNEPPPAHVRMLQLFLNTESHPEMITKLSKLQHHYKKASITDAAVEAIREAYRTHFEKK